jgi:hypothetical protein
LGSEFAPEDRATSKRKFSPNGAWELVSGECVYEAEQTKTFPGNELKLVTMTNTNNERTKFLDKVVGDYQTGGLKYIMPFNVLHLSFNSVEEILQDYTGRTVDMRVWSTDSFLAKITGQPTLIPPCTLLTMNFTPSIRSVVVRPTFHIYAYRRVKSGKFDKWAVSETEEEKFTNWRKFGAAWGAIYNNLYWIDAMSEIITGGPWPLAESVAGRVDYYYERLPQWQCP